MSPLVRPTPPGGSRWWSPSNPALWVLVVLGAAGLLILGGAVRRAFGLYPAASTAAVLLFTLYAVPFIIVLGRLDYLEREPPMLLAIALVWGGVIASMAAVYGGRAVQGILAKTISPEFATVWGPAIGPPIVEEVLKALGVVLVVLLAMEQINSTVDGFVYGAFAGLGFQIVEDFGFAVGAAAWERGDQVAPVVSTFIVRGLFTGLWSHTVFTALAGGGIAYAIIYKSKPLRHRLGIAGGALGVAITAHALWNSPLLRDGFGFGGFGIVASLFIKGLPVFLLVWYLFSKAYRAEARFYEEQLMPYKDTPLVAPDELDTLLSYREREAARRQAQTIGGYRAARAVRQLQHLQTRLAVLVSRYPEAGDWVRETLANPPTRERTHRAYKLLQRGIRRSTRNRERRRERLRKLSVQRCVVDLLATRAKLESCGLEVAYANTPRRSAMTPWAFGLGVLGVLAPGVGVFAVITALLATRGHLLSSGLAVAAVALGVLTSMGWGIAYLLIHMGAS